MTKTKKLMITLYSLLIVSFFGSLIQTFVEIAFLNKSMEALGTYFFLNIVFVLAAIGLMNLDIFIDDKRQLSIKGCLIRGLVAALIFIIFYFSNFFSVVQPLTALINSALMLYYIFFFVFIEFCFFRVMEQFLKNNKEIFD